MPISRNQIARNKKYHQKNEHVAQISRKTSILANICQKHKIGEFSFKNCRFAGIDGKITWIDHEFIKGNIKHGIMIVKATSMQESNNDIYDLVKIANDKFERDSAKKQEEVEKSLREIERLREEDSKQNNPNIVEETQPEIKINTEQSSKKKKKKEEKTAKTIRSKAVNQLREQMSNDMKKPDGNKFYRNFMKDMRAKFTLIDQPSYYYFEVKSDATDMVVDGVKTYRIDIPGKSNDIYLLLIGDLQIKRGLIKQIDPAYQSDQTMEEQNDFLKRILEKENIKTTVFDEDLPPLIEKDLDDDTFNTDPVENNDDTFNTDPIENNDDTFNTDPAQYYN